MTQHRTTQHRASDPKSDMNELQAIAMGVHDPQLADDTAQASLTAIAANADRIRGQDPNIDSFQTLAMRLAQIHTDIAAKP